MMTTAVCFIKLQELLVCSRSVCSADDYVDYDSDYDAKAEAARGIPDIDPYAGML